MKARKSNLLLMLNQQSTTNKEIKMTEETKNNSRDRKFAFYKTTNDVTGDTTIVKATSVATAEAHAKKEALKKIASFTTVKLDADGIVELATNGFDLKSVVVIEAASKKAVKADGSAPALLPLPPLRNLRLLLRLLPCSALIPSPDRRNAP